MAEFGQPNPFPFRFGGGKSTREQERIALESSFRRDGYDPSDPTKAAEAYALAHASAVIWAVSERNRGAEIPSRMQETLVDFETNLRVRAETGEFIADRRRNVAAKLRALSGQATYFDIEDVCRAQLGGAFEGVALVDPSDFYAYQPGRNPGPPGFEWSTTRSLIGIQIRQPPSNGDQRWQSRQSRLFRLLKTYLPAYMWFEIGRDDGGFTVGEQFGGGLLGVTFL